MDGGTADLVHVEQAQGRGGGHDIDDGVQRPHLVEVDLFDPHPMDRGFGPADDLKDRDGVRCYLRWEAALPDDPPDFTEAPVLVFRRFVPVAAVAVMVMAGRDGSVMVMSVPVIMAGDVIHVPAGGRVQDIELGPHEPLPGHPCWPESRTLPG